MKNFITTIIILLAPAITFAQPIIPEKGDVFNDTEVPRIDITIHPDTLIWLFDNPEVDIEFHADFLFTSTNLVEGFEDIGFRFRGNTSRYSNKKSFKISFNTFVDGGNFHGFEKMNINGEHNDPSVCRSKIGWEMARRIELPGSRANHVELYINGDYFGLYINVEHIDEEFTKEYFDSKSGNLYKCLWPADLLWKGNNPDNYKEEYSGRRAYELKINEDIDDYSDLRDLIHVLNNSPSADFFYDLNEIFSTQDYLKVMALEIVLGHWDDYIYNKNNYYLYHNPLTNKFEFLLYDLDNTMGIDWSGINWASRNIYQWDPDWEERPLYEGIMNNEILRGQFTYYMGEIAQIIASQEFEDYIMGLKEMVRPYIIPDPYYPLDYGYSIDDFDRSFTETIGDHVKRGILPFLQERADFVNSQLEEIDMYPVLKYASRNAPGAFSDLRVSVFAEDDNEDMVVQLQYRLPGEPPQYSQLFDDGLHGDEQAGDNIYGGSIEPIGFATTLEYNIIATDNASQTSRLFEESQIIDIQVGGNYQLYINEFMASNQTTIADEYGQYDDWIELWNGGDNTINLGGMYLSDKNDNPAKWMFPDVSIAPGEFLIIWADKEEEQGLLHTNFKLSKLGEFIGLYDNEASGYAVIDEISFGEQTEDVSYGRERDGDMNWITFDEPTPGTTNHPNGIDDILEGDISVFPVPAGKTITVSLNNIKESKDISIYNSLSQKMSTVTLQDENTMVDISSYVPGVYFIVDKENSTVLRFIKQ